MSDESSSQSDHGSFFTGFAVGMLAGVVSYFLFATDRGEKVRESLKEEWQDAQKRAVRETGQATVVSVRAIVKDVLDQVTKKLDSFDTEEKPTPAKAAPKKKKEPAKTGNKFKGV